MSRPPAQTYRDPEVPGAVSAERRLAERRKAAQAQGTRDRKRQGRLRPQLRHLAIGAAVMSVIGLVSLLVLRVSFDVTARWMGVALTFTGIATPVTLVFAFGTKIPPRPEDGAPPISRSRIG